MFGACRLEGYSMTGQLGVARRQMAGKRSHLGTPLPIKAVTLEREKHARIPVWLHRQSEQFIFDVSFIFLDLSCANTKPPPPPVVPTLPLPTLAPSALADNVPTPSLAASATSHPAATLSRGEATAN